MGKTDRDNVLISKIYKQLNAARYQKNKHHNKKMGGGPKQTFLQRQHTDGQQTHEKMLNTAPNYRHANQNSYELSPHTNQNGHHQKIYKQ